VFDNAMHDFDRLKTFHGTLDWLARHQPRCHRAIEESPAPAAGFPLPEATFRTGASSSTRATAGR
jgi:hypothetical protein